LWRFVVEYLTLQSLAINFAINTPKKVFGIVLNWKTKTQTSHQRTNKDLWIRGIVKNCIMEDQNQPAKDK